MASDQGNTETHTGLHLATYQEGVWTRLGVVRGERVLDLGKAAELLGEIDDGSFSDMLVLVAGGERSLARVRSLVERAPAEAERDLSAIRFLAPIPRPTKNVFCLGRNYPEHAAESLRARGQEVKMPAYPNYFTKAVTSVTGPYDPIPYDPRITQRMDWEVELAVIIGTGGRYISREEAMSHVFGYTVLNDISARDVQNRQGVQFFLGKSLVGSCPMGPWIVTADGIPEPGALELRCSVNGVVKQEDHVGSMFYDIPRLIEALSEVLPLEPGDIIATGTPAGVGFARNPPEFLQPGDVLESSISQIGTMRNVITQVERPS